MLKTTVALAFCLVAAGAARAETLGACAWSHVQPADKQAFLTAYRTGMDAGVQTLQAEDARLHAAVVECTHRDDVPGLWAQALVGSQALQAGAADLLLSGRAISRDALDVAWRGAPEPARQCTLANAAKLFDVEQGCKDPSAPNAFLTELKLSPAADRALTTQALYYFNAKAQSIWAEALISKFLAEPIKVP